MRGVAGVCVLLGIPAASGLLQCLTAQPRVRLPAAPAHFCRAAVAACEAPPPSPAPPSPSQLSVKTYKPSALPATGRAGSLRTRLDELRSLTSQHGVALPSAANGSPPSLIRWASRQRMLRRTGALSDSMVDELDELGFVWDPLMHAWEQRLEELEAFAAENGHASPPVDYAQSPGLPAWVARQRVLHKRGELLLARREALEQLGFEFDPSSAKWEQRFAEFARHMRRAGSGRKLPEPLRLWAARQRASYREGRLSPERAEALLQLDGWAWTPLAARGPSALRRLRERLHREVSTSEEQEEVYSAGAREPHCYPRCASVGRALIVSVGARREYAAAEMVDAREALRALGYTVTTVQNPSASELRAALIAHATRDGWDGHASSVVALMAHGSDAAIECQDGEAASLRSLFGLLGPSAAPALRGKPKIFLVQACRVGEESALLLEPPATERCGAVPLGDCAAPPAEEPPPARRSELCDDHDFLWGYATTAGGLAYRGAL